ncbi:hypothetical protein A4D02_29285 [Niastella koreensis]|uniref:Outer membrane protein beta-barrel domain-containing protein n=2 Tax=Niastella koreensis TaxID=354356 RepID=G8TPC8_NIAKG|nr:outer membrane beta-barrel protein [Niastella koreensis]AEV96734.1 hypothetical protein Niako_0336 [Niastella koreensis GR20-10]OQP49092.1 hypothetical protein A4D02_29285 [Niastella koreensis]
MYPLDDDNLDHLSREAAELFEVEAGASGWDHLEQRLDKELPQEKKRRRFLFWLFFITVATGGALTAILRHQPVNPLAQNATSAVTSVDKTTALPENQTADSRTPYSTQTKTVSGANNNETPVTSATNGKQLPAGNNQQSIAGAPNTTPGSNPGKPAINEPVTATTVTATNKGVVTQPVEKTTVTATKGAKAGRVRIQKAPATLNYATIATGAGSNQGYKPAKQKGKRSGTSGDYNNQVTSAVPDKNATGTSGTENNTTTAERATTGQPVETNSEVAKVQPNTATQTDSVKNKPAATTQAVDSTKNMAKAKEKKKNDKVKQPLEFGVIVGPDMSAVSFGPLYKPGYNFGVQVGYRFNDRWSVNVGAIYTKKFYKTDSSHFNYKENPWPNRNLSKVEGNCAMWEFPVNVRYDFSFNNKRRWFASTGLSTYLMDKEDYDVYYRWNGSTYPMPLSNNTNSTYLFSILNLSVGMERSLGKRFSLQAEPYLKIPLKDLGLGNMRMNSYGILFTLKYKPFLQSKRSDNNK